MSLKIKIKSIAVFVCNKSISMFIRHTHNEHLKLLAIVVGITLLLSVPLGVSLHFNLFTPSSEPWFIITWFSDLLMSFLDMHKVSYIGVTYLLALLTHLLAEEMIGSQTMRDQILRETLISELRVNTRAVLITMTNGLSLIFMLSIGVAIILITFICFGSAEFTEKLGLLNSDIISFIVMAAVFEVALFIILKWVVLPYETAIKNNSQNLKCFKDEILSNKIPVENKIQS